MTLYYGYWYNNFSNQDAGFNMDNSARTAAEQGVASDVNRPVRDHCGRGRTAKSPSVRGQDGPGAVFLRQDGDGQQ